MPPAGARGPSRFRCRTAWPSTAPPTLSMSPTRGAQLSVIDTTGCSASRTTGCGHPKATIKVGRGPTGVVVDQSTQTVYVTNNGGSTLSVIDGATCNAEDQSGCERRQSPSSAGEAPFAIALDQATDTVYVTDLGMSTRCSPTVLAREGDAVVLRVGQRLGIGEELCPGGRRLDVRSRKHRLVVEQGDRVGVERVTVDGAVELRLGLLSGAERRDGFGPRAA